MSLKDAKKKALAELIKKMRMQENKEEAKEDPVEEAAESPEEEAMEDSEELDGKKKPGKMDAGPVDDDALDKKNFMKGKKASVGGKTKSIIIGVSMGAPKPGKGGKARKY